MENESPNLKNLRILRLRSFLVDRNWELIKAACAGFLPDVDETWERLYHSLKAEVYQACFLVGEREGNPSVLGLVILRLDVDPITAERSLCIWYAYWYNSFKPEEYQFVFEDLLQYARALGCARLTAVTDKDSLVEIAESLGGRVAQKLLTFEVNENGRTHLPVHASGLLDGASLASAGRDDGDL